MARVRVLVGTRKGAFVLTSDGEAARTGTSSGPHFGGWEIYHVEGSPADPDRLYASQSSGWFGQVIQRSDDGGRTWEPVGNEFAYEGEDGHAPAGTTARRIRGSSSGSGTSSRRSTTRTRCTPGSRTRRCSDRPTAARAGTSCPGLRGHAPAPTGSPARAGMCLHTILLDPTDPRRMYIAISAAGAFRTDDGGETWRPINRGLRSESSRTPTPRSVTACTTSRCTRPAPTRSSCRSTGTSCAATTPASMDEVSGNLPTDFGFPIAVHAHEPETVYVVPIKSDSEHYPPDGKLRVYRSRTGGNEWEPLTNGLPQEDCYVNVLRDAMAVDTLDSCGVYFGTTGGQVYASPDGGDTWRADRRATCRPCCPSRCRRSRDERPGRAAGAPAHARGRGRGGPRRGPRPAHDQGVLDALESAYPALRGTIRDHASAERRPYMRYFACGRDLSHDPTDQPLPDPVVRGAEAFCVIGAIAGG